MLTATRLAHFCLQGAQIVKSAPALLAMQPSSLAAKVQRLQGYAATHPRWQSILNGTSPSTIAVQLTYSRARQLRLDYLVEKNLQSEVSLLPAVQKPDAWFQSQFTDFVAWQAQQGKLLLEKEKRQQLLQQNQELLQQQQEAQGLGVAQALLQQLQQQKLHQKGQRSEQDGRLDPDSSDGHVHAGSDGEQEQQQDTSLGDLERELQATAEEQFKIALQRHAAEKSLLAGTAM